MKLTFPIPFRRSAAAVLAVATGLLFSGRAAFAVPTVIPVSPAALQKAVAAHRGHLVLVNFWATWCAPCVAELPALAQLQKAEASHGLVVLLVSADDPSTLAQVKTTLAAKGQNASFLIKGDMPDFFNAFVPSDKGTIGLPRSYVYNRRGALVTTVPNDHTLAEYQAILKPYLRQK